MLDVANKYETELQELFMNTWYDEKYKYFHNSNYYQNFTTDKSNWDKYEFVSKDKCENIIGYIAYFIDRCNDSVCGLSIINFTDDKVTFGIDLKTALKNIFEKFNFRKLTFSVMVGNPIEKSYDKMINRYNGSIVGIQKKHIRLVDGKYYDTKIYEIFREDYLYNYKKR